MSVFRFVCVCVYHCLCVYLMCVVVHQNAAPLVSDIDHFKPQSNV